MTDYNKVVEALKRLTEYYSCPCGAWFGNEDKRPHAMGCPVEQALPLVRRLIEERDSLEATAGRFMQERDALREENERLKNKLRSYEDANGLSYIDSLQARLSAAENASEHLADLLDRAEEATDVLRKWFTGASERAQRAEEENERLKERLDVGAYGHKVADLQSRLSAAEGAVNFWQTASNEQATKLQRAEAAAEVQVRTLTAALDLSQKRLAQAEEENEQLREHWEKAEENVEVFLARLSAAERELTTADEDNDALTGQLQRAEEAIDAKDDIINDQVERLERAEAVVEAAKVEVRGTKALYRPRPDLLADALRRYEEGKK